jgi:hypothetical protein
MSQPYLWQDQRDPRAAIEQALTELERAGWIHVHGSPLSIPAAVLWRALAGEYSLSTCSSAWGDRDSHGVNGAHRCSRPVGHPGRCTCGVWHCMSWRQP